MSGSYTFPFLASVIVGIVIGASVMYYMGITPGPPVTVTTTAVVSVPFPVTITTTARQVTTATQTTTAMVTVPVQTTRTVTQNITTTQTHEVTRTTTATSTVTSTLTVTNATTFTTTLTTTSVRTTTVLTSVITATTSTVTTTSTTTITIRPQTVVCFSATQDCASMISYLIGRANVSIHVAIYVFTNPQLADALIAAHYRGVGVIVVVERGNANVTGSQVNRLMSNNITVVLDGNQYLMHHKFAVIDGEFVIVGSYNWSLAAEDRNDESLVIIRDKDIATLFEEEFRRLLLEAGYE